MELTLCWIYLSSAREGPLVPQEHPRVFICTALGPNGTELRSFRYMAGRKVGSDVAEDLTRESLIALSYSLPDSDLPPTELRKNVKSVTEAVNADEKDKVRCNLISISYAESPDTKDSPVSPEKNKN